MTINGLPRFPNQALQTPFPKGFESCDISYAVGKLGDGQRVVQLQPHEQNNMCGHWLACQFASDPMTKAQKDDIRQRRALLRQKIQKLKAEQPKNAEEANQLSITKAVNEAFKKWSREYEDNFVIQYKAANEANVKSKIGMLRMQEEYKNCSDGNLEQIARQFIEWDAIQCATQEIEKRADDEKKKIEKEILQQNNNAFKARVKELMDIAEKDPARLKQAEEMLKTELELSLEGSYKKREIAEKQFSEIEVKRQLEKQIREDVRKEEAQKGVALVNTYLKVIKACETWRVHMKPFLQDSLLDLAVKNLTYFAYDMSPTAESAAATLNELTNQSAAEAVATVAGSAATGAKSAVNWLWGVTASVANRAIGAVDVATLTMRQDAKEAAEEQADELHAAKKDALVPGAAGSTQAEAMKMRQEYENDEKEFEKEEMSFGEPRLGDFEIIDNKFS